MDSNQLMKESWQLLFRFIPTRMPTLWNSSRLDQIKDTVKDASLETVEIMKRLAANTKTTVNDLLLSFPSGRRGLIRSAVDNHTFISKVDWHNRTVKFERNQSDFLPPIRLDTVKQYQETRLLLTADIILECVIFALNLAGYPVTSLDKIRFTLSKVRIMLQSEDMLSFFSKVLEIGKGNAYIWSVKQVFDLLYRLYKKGLLLELIRDLIDATDWRDILIAVAKITVLIVAAVKNFNEFRLLENLLKGSELLNKIATLKQLSVDLKSKL